MLPKILAHKRTEIAALDEVEQRRRALDAPAPRPFLPPFIDKDEAGPRPVRLIAELKRASPSRGLLAPNVDMEAMARVYAANGAAAISVLTDEKFFMGSLALLSRLRDASDLALPLLRKDFILSAAQVYETRAAGADALLLIVAALDDTPDNAPGGGGGCSLAELHALALELGLTPLVEVHSRLELERALRLPGLELVGINNRDLSTFTVSLDTTAELRPLLPAGLRVVSESGIFSAADVARLGAIGVDAVLVGEGIIAASNPGAKVRELSGHAR